MAQYDDLISQSSVLVNKAAKTEDAATKKKLIAQAKALKAQADAIKAAEAKVTGNQKYSEAQKELKRLQALPPTTPGLAATIRQQQGVVDRLKPVAETPAPTPTPTPTPNAKTTSFNDVNKNGIPDNLESAASTKAAADAAAKKATDAAAAKKAAADKIVAEKDLALKTMYVDFLRSTFAGLEDKTQKAEIDSLFERASKEGWTSDLFQQQLEGTSWWQTTLPSLRSWYLNTHDPRKQSTTVELIRNKVASVSSYLEKLGITVQGIDPVTGKAFDKSGYVSGIAQEAVKNGWDDNQLRDYLAGQAPIVFTGGGEIGSSLSKIRDTAYAYGVKLDPTYEKMINNSLLDSSDGRDAQYYIAEMRRQAIENPNNKAFTEALNSGRTLYEATRSYRNQMAGLLEVDESNVTWDDLMKKTVDSNTGAARTFADFTKQVKSDPLWQTTRNAKETYSTTALDLAKMFGLVG
jgi:chemotaxis protein histidine kinase CheA